MMIKNATMLVGM